MEARQRWISEVQALFQEADMDGDGTLAWPEFKNKLEDVRVLALFSKLGIDVESQSKKGLFTQFDLNGDGTIEIDEFASALQSVHGNARSLDMMVLRHENKLVKKHMSDLKLVCQSIASTLGVGTLGVGQVDCQNHQEGSKVPTNMHLLQPVQTAPDCASLAVNDLGSSD